MSFGEALKPKEQLAVTAFLLGYEAGEIELGNRNVDRQVTDALGTHAPGGPLSEVWLDSAMTKLGIPTYYALSVRAKELSKQGALTLKTKTSNHDEIKKVMAGRAELELRGRGPTPTNSAAEIERNRKLQEF